MGDGMTSSTDGKRDARRDDRGLLRVLARLSEATDGLVWEAGSGEKATSDDPPPALSRSSPQPNLLAATALDQSRRPGLWAGSARPERCVPKYRS